MVIKQASPAARFISPFAGAALLAGCAMTPMGPSVQVMPGPGKTLEAFQADNLACKSYAAESVKGQADVANQRAVGAALLTTALGAGLGAATGDFSGSAAGGAALGAAVGAGGGAAIGGVASSNDQLNIQAQYDSAFSQCMYAKGDQVPGYAPVAMSRPAPSGPAPSPLVRDIQSELIRLGYLKGAADGFSGPMTRAAINSYEQANGLSVDGSVSSRLLAKLQATPTGSGTATASAPPASAPTTWVAPTSGSPAVTPAAATASAPAGGWVAPTKSP